MFKVKEGMPTVEPPASTAAVATASEALVGDGLKPNYVINFAVAYAVLLVGSAVTVSSLGTERATATTNWSNVSDVEKPLSSNVNVIGDDAARKDPVEERPRSVRSDHVRLPNVLPMPSQGNRLYTKKQ
jgi:hypothetical protein